VVLRFSREEASRLDTRGRFADSTDAAARVDFSNTRADSLYWLDNVKIVPVTVAAIDPREKSRLFYNPTLQNLAVSLSGKRYRDLDGDLVEGTITLAPFMSRILVLDTGVSGVLRPERKGNGNAPLSITRRAGGRQVAIMVTSGAPGNMVVTLFDFSGRRIAVLYNGPAGNGTRVIDWTESAGKNALPSGACYLMSITLGKTACVEKVVNIR
jgi:hypothetical protein